MVDRGHFTRLSEEIGSKETLQHQVWPMYSHNNDTDPGRQALYQF
jgi:hypothetical protein